MARVRLLAFGAQLCRIKEQILEFNRLIRGWLRSNEMSMRLEDAPASVRCWPLLWLLPLLIQVLVIRTQLLRQSYRAETALERRQK
ncbi:hypothetical protein SAMN05444170_0009 [Bradyrhizobium erythrophlei]|uniref:Uncharacterized protein n=1 Tax=Bradyrhizobium erythrophlei TaxID=1437360 RepID=A0A1M7SQ25_9BRAD|nr:hypothetical protein SAMN05444170_0009 [Bradyrhizobium erythrophlei]